MRRICEVAGIEFEEGLVSPYQNLDQKMLQAVGKSAYALGDFKFHQFSGIQTGSAERWKEHYRTDFLLPETVQCMRCLGYETIEDLARTA